MQIVVCRVRLCVVCNDDVRPAVPVEVADANAERFGMRIKNAGFPRDVGKAPVLIIVVETARLAGVFLRTAVGLEGGPAGPVGGLGPGDVVTNKEVEPAIAIE